MTCKINNPMTVTELAKMYKVSMSKMYTIVGRGDFAKFDLGQMEVINPKTLRKMKVLCYNCNEKFDELIQKYLPKKRKRNRK